MTETAIVSIDEEIELQETLAFYDRAPEESLRIFGNVSLNDLLKKIDGLYRNTDKIPKKLVAVCDYALISHLFNSAPDKAMDSVQEIVDNTPLKMLDSILEHCNTSIAQESLRIKQLATPSAIDISLFSQNVDNPDYSYLDRAGLGICYMENSYFKGQILIEKINTTDRTIEINSDNEFIGKHRVHIESCIKSCAKLIDLFDYSYMFTAHEGVAYYIKQRFTNAKHVSLHYRSLHDQNFGLFPN